MNIEERVTGLEWQVGWNKHRIIALGERIDACFDNTDALWSELKDLRESKADEEETHLAFKTYAERIKALEVKHEAMFDADIVALLAIEKLLAGQTKRIQGLEDRECARVTPEWLRGCRVEDTAAGLEYLRNTVDSQARHITVLTWALTGIVIGLIAALLL